jgi:hypothetical protein
MAHSGSDTDFHRLGQALVELTKRPELRSEDPSRLLEQIPAAQLVEMACHHRVPGVVYRSLADLGIEDEGYTGLRIAYQMASLAHGRCLLEVAALTDILGELEQPWLVVKGPVLAEVGYGDPGARLYEDLDLVVAASDLARALSLIGSAGGHEEDLNWPMMLQLRRAEIPVTLPSGMLGDLHWHLLVTPNTRDRFHISMPELLERRRTVRVGGSEVTTLDTIDGLIYLCLHGSLSGGHQLVWLKDIERMVANEPPDWDELVRRSRKAGTDLVLAMQLERARAVLGASVPPGVIEVLAGGRRWWRWWQRREAKVGVARWGGYDGTGRTFMAATSGGTRSSTAQLVRSGTDETVVPALTHWFRRSGAADDQLPPLYRPVGDAADRAEYLRRVGAGAWERPGSPSSVTRPAPDGIAATGAGLH